MKANESFLGVYIKDSSWHCEQALVSVCVLNHLLVRSGMHRALSLTCMHLNGIMLGHKGYWYLTLSLESEATSLSSLLMNLYCLSLKCLAVWHLIDWWVVTLEMRFAASVFRFCVGVGNIWIFRIASHHRRLKSSSAPLWEPQIFHWWSYNYRCGINVKHWYHSCHHFDNALTGCTL